MSATESRHKEADIFKVYRYRSRAIYVIMAMIMSCAAVVGAYLIVRPIGQKVGFRGMPPGYARLWQTPLPRRTPLAVGSAVVINNLIGQFHESYGSVGVNNGDFGLAIFTATARTLRTPVSVAPGCHDFRPDTGSAIPIPENAAPPAGSDGSLVIVEPATETEWELWKARRQPNGSWSACWGGRLTGAVVSGTFPAPYGLAASGIAYLATAVTFGDVSAGEIRHAVDMSVVLCNGSVSPASRTDCGRDDGQPSEGTRLRLPADLKPPGGLTPFARMLFDALQTYGAVVTDHAGAVMIGAETADDWRAQGHAGVDPITRSFAGKPEYEALNGIPWDRLEVLQPSSGQ